eukprot:5717082-Pyramimonas_sp.AAC.1
MCVPLCSVAAVTALDNQKGGARGRDMLANIVEAEAWGMEQWGTGSKHAAELLADFSAAFPFVFIRWIRSVLTRMGSPTSIIAFFQELHRANKGW